MVNAYSENLSSGPLKYSYNTKQLSSLLVHGMNGTSSKPVPVHILMSVANDSTCILVALAHTHIHTRTHACTHARTHARTHREADRDRHTHRDRDREGWGGWR